MESRKFPQANIAYAKDQDEYQTLYSHAKGNVSTFSFKLTEDEIKQVVETGTIYLSIMNFKQPLQPIGPSLLDPFK